MNFISIEFSVVFLLFFVAYWLLRPYPTKQNILLLLISYLLMFSHGKYGTLVLAGYTTVIYFLTLEIGRSKKRKKLWLVITLTMAIGNLAIFKYFDFFRSNLQLAFTLLDIDIMLPGLNVLIPIGISFYTFHSVSYVVSVYRREMKPLKFWEFALFLSFFPSVIAGPINRAKAFVPQILVKKPREIEHFHRAAILIILAIMKVLWLNAYLADTWVTPVFDNPLAYNSFDLLLGLYAYTIQIYLNFSGYTELVMGIALLLGFQLPINFNCPYLAINIRDFWTRWHISLSTWIRDYIYIPLGGSRFGFGRTQLNLMIAMFLSGLWHGAGYNFIIWGFIHGFAVIFLNISDRFIGKGLISRSMPRLACFITIQYVAFTWIFFRSENFGMSLDFITALFVNKDVELQFNSPFYLLTFFLLFLIYPLLTKLPALLEKCLKKVPWILLPFFFITAIWLFITFAPAGIPGFIYANF